MDTTEAPQQPEQATFTPLTQEERNDLRKKVLAGYQLSVEEARRVCETLSQGQGAAMLAKEKKGKKGTKTKKAGMADADFEKSLEETLKKIGDLGGGSDSSTG